MLNCHPAPQGCRSYDGTSNVIEGHINDDWYCRNSVAEDKVPLLQTPQLSSIVSIEEYQEDIDSHAKDLCA